MTELRAKRYDRRTYLRTRDLGRSSKTYTTWIVEFDEEYLFREWIKGHREIITSFADTHGMNIEIKHYGGIVMVDSEEDAILLYLAFA